MTANPDNVMPNTYISASAAPAMRNRPIRPNTAIISPTTRSLKSSICTLSLTVKGKLRRHRRIDIDPGQSRQARRPAPLADAAKPPLAGRNLHARCRPAGRTAAGTVCRGRGRQPDPLRSDVRGLGAGPDVGARGPHAAPPAVRVAAGPQRPAVALSPRTPDHLRRTRCRGRHGD